MEKPQAPSSRQIQHAIQVIVASIPPGRVMSYGAVARAAGYPGHIRLVSTALRASPTDLPWFRVLNAQGIIPVRGLEGDEALQRVLLASEGLVFDTQGRIARKSGAWWTPPAANMANRSLTEKYHEKALSATGNNQEP